MLTDVYQPKYQAMWQASVKMVTDIGLMEACSKITDENGKRISHYMNQQVNVTHVRGAGRQGYCIPIECKTESLDFFNEKFFGYMNKMLPTLPQYGIDIETIIFNSKSLLGSRMTVPEEYNQLQIDKTTVGRRVVSTVLVMIIMASLGSNITWGIQHLINDQEKNEEDLMILPVESSHFSSVVKCRAANWSEF